MSRFIILMCLMFFSLASVMAQCNIQNTVFQSGERLMYHASYNWGFIWLDAGIAEFVVSERSVNNVNMYHFNSTGRSYPEYDWFFMVRDTFQSTADVTSLQSATYRRRTNEGAYSVWNDYRFDKDQQLIYTRSGNTEKSTVRDTFPNEECYYDLLTAIYFFRNLSFDTMKLGEEVKMKMIVDNELFPDLYARYLGIDTLTMRNGKQYRCHVLKPMLVEGTMFKGGEHMKVWVSADRNRVPLMIEAELLIGSVKAYLVSYSGLRHAFESGVD